MGEEPRTQDLLADMRRGDRAAADQLFERVYEELRSLAEGYFRRQPGKHTMQPTALVHEAYMRLVGESAASFENRAHFRAVAAKAMRNLLIDRARRKEYVKHGGGAGHVTLDERLVASADAKEEEFELERLAEALRRLSELDDRKCQVVVCRFFGGLSLVETAQALGIARSTVADDWRMARAWLIGELRDEDGEQRG